MIDVEAITSDEGQLVTLTSKETRNQRQNLYPLELWKVYNNVCELKSSHNTRQQN